jgi:hypothetical protein
MKVMPAGMPTEDTPPCGITPPLLRSPSGTVIAG